MLALTVGIATPLLVLCLLPLISLGVWIVVKAVRFRDWVRARGEVIELRMIGTDGSLAPVFSYPGPNGRIYTIDGTVGQDPPKYAVGDVVEVRYPHDAPERACISTFTQLWFLEILLFIVVSALTIMLIGLLFLASGIFEWF